MSRRASRALLALGALAVAALVPIAWRGVLDLALLGWDSYPLIAAGRIAGAGDLVATLGEELMDGAYPLGRFWRPVVHLSFGMDHALWGLEPRGYHATDLALLALSGMALILLASRLLANGAWLAPLVGGVLYVLHPVQLEILPVAARRAEALAVLFSLLALLAQPLPLPGQQVRRGRAWLAALCCALALASKETGAMATGFVLALALAAAPQRGWGQRVGAALRAAWPSLVLFAATFAARFAALGGLGGSRESSLTANLSSAPAVLRGYLADLVAPQAFFGQASPLVADVLVVLLVVVLVRLVRSPAGRQRTGEELAPLTSDRVALFLLLGLVVVAAITSVSGLERGWYALPFLPLYALAVALALQLGLRGVAGGPRVAGVVAVLLVARLVVVPTMAIDRTAALAPLERASRDETAFLERFDATVAAAAPGTSVVVAGVPTERRADPTDPDSPNILMLAPYSVQAYATLRFPDRRLRFELAGRVSGRAPEADELVVVLTP